MGDVERRLSEKDEEIDNTRRNGVRVLEGIQSQLDAEIRSRSEAVRIKKKMEGEISDLEIQLAHANRQYTDAARANKDITGQIKDVQMSIDDTERQADDIKEQCAVTERRQNLLQAEIDELRVSVEQAEKGRKMAEQELMEANERANLLHAQNTALANQKRKIEQEQCSHMTRLKKNMEDQLKDLQSRLDEAEQVALKGGKKQVQKLESRVRELESELDAEQRRASEGQKSVRKLERKVKEAGYAGEEDKKKLLTATCPNTENFNTNSMKLKKELTLLNPLWANLELARTSKCLILL